jgi:hypothetical protein
MSKIGRDIRLVVVGTKKSQILDADEEFVLEFVKDEELREDFSDANELINSFLETSLYRGDMIRSLVIDGNDIVQQAIIEILNRYSMNVNDAFPEVFALPFLCNADSSDIFELVTVMRSSLETEADPSEVDPDEF